MTDRQIPMEPAEVLTVAPDPPKQQDTYGTSAPKKVKKNHTVLIAAVCTVCVVSATVLAVVGISALQLDAADGRLHLTQDDVQTQGSEQPKDKELQPNDDVQPQPPQQNNDDGQQLQLDGTPQRADKGMSVQALYTAVSPSVVCLTAESYYGSNVGTGVVLDENGYLLAAAEPLTGATAITVTLQNGTIGSAEYIGTDSTTGLALLHCDLEGLPPATFGDASTLLVGDRLYCIGNPYGDQLRNVLDEGILTVCGTVTVSDEEFTLLQTDASFGADCTGCPVFDTAGNLIAVTCPIGTRLTSSGESADLAISATDIQRIAERIAANAASAGTRWLGFEVAEIPTSYRFYYGFPGSLWITEVGDGTYADGALSVYDVILSVNGVSVSTVEEYDAVLAGCSLGDTVELRIFRGGFYYSIKLPLTEQ